MSDDVNNKDDFASHIGYNVPVDPILSVGGRFR